MRDGLSESFRAQASERILEILAGCTEYPSVRQIFLFCTLGSEPQTAPWMERFWRDGKSVSCPRTQRKGRMDFYEIQRMEDLLPGRYGILEPAETCPESIPDLDTWILTPGLWFDDRGYRLGYGGGFSGWIHGADFRRRIIWELDFPVSAGRRDGLYVPLTKGLERLVTEQGVYYFEEVGE